MPDARNEYDDYAGTLGRLLREGAREAEIASFLRDVEQEHITLAGDAPKAAHKIVEWYDRVMAQLGRDETRDKALRDDRRGSVPDATGRWS